MNLYKNFKKSKISIEYLCKIKHFGVQIKFKFIIKR